MTRVKTVWWIPIMACIFAGIATLIPVDTAESGKFLPYEPLVPFAPISSAALWIMGLLFFYLGRQVTERPLRPWK